MRAFAITASFVFSVFELNAMVLGFRIEMRVFVNGDSGSVVRNIPRSCCFFFVFSFFLEIFLGDLAVRGQFCIESVGLWLLSALYSDFGNVWSALYVVFICPDARESRLVLRIVLCFFVSRVLRVVICFVSGCCAWSEVRF